MVDKRISDLEVTNDLQDTTLFHVRKTETNEDFKITKANLVKQIGNSVVSGFNATSPSANRILLTPSNSGSLDQYYDGMTIKFISPINSTDLVKIKIGSLAYIDFKTTFTNPITNVVENGVLKTGKFYEAIYSNNSFIQTNIDRQYTNEYLSVGEIIFDNVTQEYFTLYTLTSATSYYKTQYYEGMSIVFTSGIIANSVENMSNGKIYINVDGLGVKLLSDPDGDGVPFSLQPNETILGIYDGEKFIKNMFSMQEPELPVPVDPVNPPPGYDITVYVGPNELEASNRLLQTAYDRIVKDYGNEGGGRKVLIKFRDNYTGEGLKLESYAPYVTFEGNTNVTMKFSSAEYTFGNKGVFTCSGYGGSRILNLIGIWKVNFPIASSSFEKSNSFIYIDGLRQSFALYLNIKNAIITNNNQGNQNYSFFYSFYEAKREVYTTIIFSIENSEIQNFGEIFCAAPSIQYELNLQNVTIKNTITQTRNFSSLLSFNASKVKIINLILNIAKPSNYQSILLMNLVEQYDSYEINDTNLEILEPTNKSISTISLGNGTQQFAGKLTISNCNIKYGPNVVNTVGSLQLLGFGNGGQGQGSVYLNGNNYVNKNSLIIPDIIVSATTLYLKSGTLGSTKTINGGQIINV
jgi:hypothetical protein